MKHDSSIHCDELISLLKSLLTNFVGSLSLNKIEELHRALSIALDIRGLKG
jgi:mRNA interferase MazF